MQSKRVYFYRQLPHESIDIQVESVDILFRRALNRTGTFEIRTDVCHVIVARNNSIELCCDER